MMPSIGRRTALAVLGSSSALCFLAADARCYTREGEPEITWDPIGRLLTLTSGCATMADLVNLRTSSGDNMGPVYHFSKDDNWYSDSYTGTYYLESDLYVEGGAKLSIDGDDGDRDACETLFLASNDSLIVNLRAYGGYLDITRTKIFSWDLSEGDYDKEPESNGRSHISAITERITGRPEDECGEGSAVKDMGRAKMDIYKSEIAYLGYQASEAYGISYKARGLCTDLSNLDIFNDYNGLNVDVRGDIYRSDLHHNWFGHYSWGHNGGEWIGNKVHDNHVYGFDPHDDSDNLKIIGNEVYNNGWHGIIASKRCTNLIIKNNVVHNNGMSGIMLHRSSNYATIRGNHVYDNTDAGLALVESSFAKIYDNILSGNMHGLRLSNGANDNLAYDNIIENSSDNEIFTYMGTDTQEAEDNDGRNKNNQIYRNLIIPINDQVWNIKESDFNVFRNNEILDGEVVRFNDAMRNKVIGNEFPAEFDIETGSGSCFKSGSQGSPIC